jgi:hypothetical protein
MVCIESIDDQIMDLRKRAIKLVNATIDGVFELCPPNDYDVESLRNELTSSLIVDAISIVDDPEILSYSSSLDRIVRFWSNVWYDYFDPTCEHVSREKLTYLCELAMQVHSYEERKRIPVFPASDFAKNQDCIVVLTYDPETGEYQSNRHITLISAMHDYLRIDID